MIFQPGILVLTYNPTCRNLVVNMRIRERGQGGRGGEREKEREKGKGVSGA